MSRSTPRAVGSVAAFVVAAAGAWSSVIPMPPIRLMEVAAFAAAPALLAAGGARRAAALLIVVTIPASTLAAGVPIDALVPWAWPRSVGQLGTALGQVVTHGTTPAPSPWALAAVMLASGPLWLTGASSSGVRTVTRRRSSGALLLLTAPWLVGLGRTVPDHAAWQGAVVFTGAVLWFGHPRRAIPLVAGAALFSVPLAQAVGPRARWFGLDGPAIGEQRFQSLDTEPTYGPLMDRRTGAPMLEVTAPQPALWRMQTLDEFDGYGWTLGSRGFPELPQPAARTETLSVRVLGLRDDLVVAPGRIDQVIAQGSATQATGEAWRITPQPRTGGTYRLRAAYLDVGAGQLADDRAPLDPRARVYTKLGSVKPPPDLRALSLMLAPFGVPVAAFYRPAPTVDPRVAALARRLAAGAGTEWEVVARVERYLLGGGRFRYTIRVPQPGSQPLTDFLLKSHAGYCQQFAGAAALLLRLAGVPARAVAGFATGTEGTPGRYTVRDLDAHEWIEVYFQGYGWVPFNPTPAAAPATVANGLDPLRPATPGEGAPLGPLLPAALAALAVGAVVTVRRCRFRSRAHTAGAGRSLARIASNAGGIVEPSTTLAELATVLRAEVGPRTAALATQLERGRFTSDASVTAQVAQMRLAVALASDLGAVRAAILWAPRRHPPRNRGNRSGDQVGAGWPEETLDWKREPRGARTRASRRRNT
jgi:protein-glutamine gamma-glutamyltransferase